MLVIENVFSYVCQNYYYYHYNRFTTLSPDYLGEPVPEETFTHSHIVIIIQSLSVSSIYYDP